MTNLIEVSQSANCVNILSLLKKCILLFEFYSILTSGDRQDCLEELGAPLIQINLNDPVGIKLIETSINQLVLCIIFVGEDNFVSAIDNLSQVLQYNHDMKVILVIDTEDGTFVEEALQLSWKKTLTNTVVFEKSINQISMFHPYPTFRIFRNQSDFFPDKIRNMYGATITYALVYDPPRKFKYFIKNQRFNGGYAWHIFDEFAKRLNITTFEKYDYDVINKNVMDSVALFINGSVDFIPSLAFHHYDNQSYFLEYFTSYQIVPVIKNIDKFWYILSIFSLKSWLGLGLLILIFTILLSIGHKIIFRKFDLFSNFRSSTRILFFQQSVNSRLFKPKISVIYGLSLFTNLIVVTTYHSSIGSSLTKFKDINQINDFEDLKLHNIKIMVSTEEVQMIKNGQIPSFIPAKYRKEVLTMEYMDLVKLWDSLNTSFAYVLPSDKWRMFHHAQKFKNHFIFRVMEDKSSRTYRPISLPFGKKSIYRSTFDRFLIWLYSAGLISKWEKESVIEMSKGNLLFRMDLQKPSTAKPLSLKYYLLPLYILGFCSLISCGLFVGEILRVKKFK